MSKNKKEELLKEGGLAALKGLIGAIPFAGTALNEAFFEARGRIKQNRVNSFIENFGEFLSNFKEEELNLDQIREEDFSDFFEQLMVNISKTRSEAKKKAFQSLLANQLKNPKPIDYAEVILEITNSLQEKQIPILLNLNESFNSNYVDQKGYLLERERELETLNKNLKEEYNQFDSQEDFTLTPVIRRLKQKIDRINQEIERTKVRIEKVKEPYMPKTYNCEGHEFYFLIQDLINKGLLVDLGMKYNAEPFELIEISSLGIDLIESLEAPKPAGNIG